MRWFLFSIGIIWVMLGTLMLFTPQVVRDYFEKLRHVNPRLLSPIALILGVLLLISASSSSQVPFIVVLGILAILKGLLLLLGPQQKVKGITNWWFDSSNKVHKAWGAIVVAIGISVLATLSTIIR